MPLPWEHWFRATDINSDSLVSLLRRLLHWCQIHGRQMLEQVHDRHIQRQQRGEEYQRYASCATEKHEYVW